MNLIIKKAENTKKENKVTQKRRRYYLRVFTRLYPSSAIPFRNPMKKVKTAIDIYF